MMRNLNSFFSGGFILLVLLLGLIANGMGPIMMVEARTCESKSNRFNGVCFRHSNCGTVCQTEGFSGGHCRGFRRRCFCTSHC